VLRLLLDLAKALDKAPHQEVKKHGIGGKLLGVIGKWLQNRRQRVCIKGKNQVGSLFVAESHRAAY